MTICEFGQMEQLSVDEIESGQLVRVFQVQRSELIVGNGSTTWSVTGWCSVAAGKKSCACSIAGKILADTSAIREQDAKGRHTTTYRELHLLPSGGLLLDMPGIRELKLGEAGIGVSQVFDDIDALARQCQFANCQHHDEPGCAVQRAIKTGALDDRRLKNHQKLAREDARHTATLAEQRQRDRAFGKMVRQHTDAKRRR